MKPEEVEYGLRNIGERIARAGEGAGFTRRQMGELAGVDEFAVRSWEQTSSRPSLSQVKELAAGCGTPPDWLLGRDLIDEVFLEQARHSYVCLGGCALEDLPLEDLDVIRQFILWAWRHPLRSRKAPAGRGMSAVRRRRPDQAPLPLAEADAAGPARRLG